jgi:DNA-directed RNA polymerase beta' subunit
MHQTVAREGIVSTGVNTSATGYMNRKATRSMADVILTNTELNGNKIIRDHNGIISYKRSN